MWRRGVVLATALVFAAVWFAGPDSQASAGGQSWIFKPSYANYVGQSPYAGAKARWRQQLFYGGRVTGHAIYGYNRTHVRLGGRGNRSGYTGQSSYHRWESFYSISRGGY
jgi:hypothetical protein